MDEKTTGTPSIPNTETNINIIDITVGDPLDWSILPIGFGEKNMQLFWRIFGLALQMPVH